MKLIIACRCDLERAERLASWFRRPAVDQVIVNLPWLGANERHRLAEEMETHFNDCGCAWGVMAWVGALAWCFYTGPWSSAASLPAATVYTLTVSVAWALAGKATGLAWSQRRLKLLFRYMSSAEGASRSAGPMQRPRIEDSPLRGRGGW